MRKKWSLIMDETETQRRITFAFSSPVRKRTEKEKKMLKR